MKAVVNWFKSRKARVAVAGITYLTGSAYLGVIDWNKAANGVLVIVVALIAGIALEDFGTWVGGNVPGMKKPE
jgi:hypothetical protein